MFNRNNLLSVLVVFTMAVVFAAQAEDKKGAASSKIPNGAKVFVAPMADGFDTYLKEAIAKKKVPVEIVASKDQADYEITGVSDTQKAGTVKKILGNWHSREEASITVSNIKSGEVTWAYSVHKEGSAHGKRSSAEACAKHLKDDAVESK